ncbi:MAG TPA: outer membrane protein assembly factor BamB [Caldimonas sp.]|jgi:outer membrane assembly lipoprotein YfgL|nr:outer membrane protein assembly factor BamB [Caldimonas sp.]HEX4234854.1 outer membrane protein assembly factor BamB [Caldimonas sp.]
MAERATRQALRALSRIAVATLAAALVGGCSTFSSVFGSMFGPDRPKPKDLEPIVAPISVQKVWSQNIGKVEFPLTVAVSGNVLTLAASDGTVIAVEAASGRTLWRTNVGGAISAGVGSDGKVASVVTRSGELVALESGQVKWKKPIGVRVATAPLVAGARIFVLGVDRSVQAFDAGDGLKLWQVQRPGDPLTLQQTGVLAPFKDTLVVGQGPRMAGIDPGTGALRWEVPLGSPRGANEVERLADLIGPVVRINDLVCARSFQAAVGCVDAQAGNVAWTKTVGGTDAIGGDGEMLFGADASDRISAWRTVTGDIAWTNESLMFRGLGAPAAIGQSVVVGDLEGTLYWLSRAKGESQARVATDGSAVSAPPVVVEGLLVVVTRGGGVFAFRPA